MIRWCKEIGMFAIDRSCKTCRHQTRFCKLYCYNIPLYRWQKNMIPRDVANEKFWATLTGTELRDILARKKHPVDRIRLCTRGEAFSVLADVEKVRGLLDWNPETLFWIPTRGWRDPEIRAKIEAGIFPFHNARVIASVDPSNSEDMILSLQNDGWSTVRIGSPGGSRYRCPKTYEHATGHCAICLDGCFSAYRVDIHLRLHWAGGTPHYKDWQTEPFLFGAERVES